MLGAAGSGYPRDEIGYELRLILRGKPSQLHRCRGLRALAVPDTVTTAQWSAVDRVEERVVMRHCYMCDGEITGSAFRRSVGTGRSRRVSFGRRVSTSSTQRTGLRTLCSSCAGSVDAETRLKNKIVGTGLIALVGIVVFVSAQNHGTTTTPDDPTNGAHVASDAAIAHSLAADAVPPATASSPVLSDAAPAVVAPAPVSGQHGPGTTVSLPAWKSAAALRWKHTTGEGTRWSLRQLRGRGMALLIDLGDDQVATVLVTPEFQALDLPGMGRRVEFARTEIAKVSARSAAYAFSRAGVITPYP